MSQNTPINQKPPAASLTTLVLVFGILAVLLAGASQDRIGNATQKTNIQTQIDDTTVDYGSPADSAAYLANSLSKEPVYQKRTKDYTPEFPKIKLAKNSRAQDAAAELGTQMPQLAAYYGMDSSDLKNKIKNDKNIWADQSGKLYYVDDAVSANAIVSNSAAQENYLTPQLPLESTFYLHSRPGKTKVVYLDFDGHVTSGTSWNSYVSGADIVSAPFNLDGNPSVFGDSERAMIQEIWRRVSEDYAPFDIDVTTQDPGVEALRKSTTSDAAYGIRVVLSPTNWYNTGAGGTAYIGSFSWNTDTPTWAFTDQLGNYGKYIAEATSHEVGHTLGLYHDGSPAGAYYYGHGSWAPIMGVGYYGTYVQFSKGEYSGADNLQDDLQVILSYGPVYATDDVADTISAATPLLQSGSRVYSYGVIGKNTDTDMFRFNTDAGNIVLEVKPLSNGESNLDSIMELRNAQGTVLVSANPIGANVNPRIDTTVAQGTYYVSLRGTGEGNPSVDGYSNYGSLGQYLIDGTIIPGTFTTNYPPTASATAVPTSGYAPLTVSFSSAGSSDPEGSAISYVWTFGDGTTSTEANPIKVFNAQGTYNVVLSVTDNTSLSAAATVTVSVTNQPPIAAMSAAPTSGNIPTVVNADASASYDADGTLTNYNWIFGDGATGTGKTLSHTYTQGGNYNLQLTVTDNGGASASASSVINVVDPYQINAPSSLSGKASKGKVTLTWSDMSNNENGFYIERAVKTTSPIYSRITTTAANVRTYVDVPSRTQYYYRIQAFNSTTGRTSSYSNAIQVRVR